MVTYLPNIKSINKSILLSKNYSWKIISFSFLILLIAHGAYTTLFPNIVFNVSSLLIIVFLIIFYFNTSRDYWGLSIIIYICSHFDFLNKYGGLFVISSFILACLLVITRNRLFEIKIKDTAVNFLIIIFIAANILGWLFKGDISLFWKMLGIISLFGYLFVFYLTKNQFIDREKIKIFISVLIFMQFYELLVALNTYLGLFKTGITAFFPTQSRFGSFFTEGTFNHSELFGELAILSSIVFITFLLADKNYFNIKRSYLIIGLMCSILNMFMSGSRSTFFLLFLAVIMFYFLSLFLYRNHFVFTKNLRYSFIGLAVIVILWEPLKLDYLIARFTDPAKEKYFTNLESWDLITGEGTPRQLAFSYFFNTYEKDTWWIGYGWGVQNSNRKAWFGDVSVPRADYHSLYFSIIVLYGWVGSVAFILLFLITIWRLIKLLKLIKNSKSYRYYFYPIFGFLLLFIFFLLNQYKTSILRISSYHMMTWIWLGIANALYYSVKTKLKNENLLARTVSN